MRNTFFASKIELSIRSLVYTVLQLTNLGQTKLAAELVDFLVEDIEVAEFVENIKDISNFMFSLAVLKNYDMTLWKQLFRNLEKTL